MKIANPVLIVPLLSGLGGRAAAETPVTGKCEGLDSTGRLLVRAGKHLHRIIAGHVDLT